MESSKQKAEIQNKISERNLSQWHLLIASMLGSLATQGGMFNQVYLNRMLKRSMRDFVLPYFETMEKFGETQKQVNSVPAIEMKMKSIIGFVDEVFPLAEKIDVEKVDDKNVKIRVVGDTCRFCPKGIGKAELQPGQTFCPFPTIFEEAANYFLGENKIRVVITREGARTKILQKVEGECFIQYTSEG